MMVFFNCNACGESLKKNQVEKHYQIKCRRCEVVSCVDCQKEFWGDAYKEHVKCISEEEKYSGKNWKPKPNTNKGEQKQEAWIEQVSNAVAKCPSGKPALKELLRNIQDYPNIPRKKAKFENFVKNSMRVKSAYLVTEAWDILSAELQKKPPTTNGTSDKSGAETNSQSGVSVTNSQSEASSTNGQTEEDPDMKKLSKRERKEERRKKQHKAQKKDRKEEQAEDSHTKKKKKKRKYDEDIENGETQVSTEEEPDRKKKKKKQRIECEEAITSQEAGETEELTDEAPRVFQWEETIMAVLNKASDNEISVKKLKKKILAEFHATGGDGKTYTEEKLLSRLTKNILRNPKLKIEKERVKLIH